MKPIQVYLDPTEIKRLKQEALDKGLNLSDLIRLYLHIKHVAEKMPKSTAAPQKITKADKATIAIADTIIESKGVPTVIKSVNDIPKTLQSRTMSFCKEGHAIPEGRDRCLGRGCKYA